MAVLAAVAPRASVRGAVGPPEDALAMVLTSEPLAVVARAVPRRELSYALVPPASPVALVPTTVSEHHHAITV